MDRSLVETIARGVADGLFKEAGLTDPEATIPMTSEQLAAIICGTIDAIVEIIEKNS